MRVFTLVRSAVAVATIAAGLGGALLPAHAAGTVPTAPLRVVTSAPTAASLAVSWVAPASDGGNDISDYTVQYRRVGTLTWATATHTASTSTSVTIEGLAAGSAYAVRVAAVTEAGTGPWNTPDVTLSTGDTHACALTTSGTVSCWGNGANGRLGNGSGSSSAAAVAVLGIDASTPATTAVSVTSGSAHSCALMATGTIKCWGTGQYGRLGNGATTDNASPVNVTVIDAATAATTAVSVSAGAYHTCAVMADRTIRCWGYGFYGQLGNGGNGSNNTNPVTVSTIDGASDATAAVSVAAGGLSTCAVMASGAARCWGYNSDGRLGDGTTSARNTPVGVSGITGADAGHSAASLSAAATHACAVLVSGAAKCWGNNGGYQLGNGTNVTSTTPVEVSGIDGSTESTSAVVISAGYYHSCLLLASGTAACWGDDTYGQLGDGRTSARSTPVSVNYRDASTLARTFATVSVGLAHTCALLATGAATCWGYSDQGRLGDGLLSGVSLGSAGSTSTAAPSVPTSVVASNAASTTIDLAWTAPTSNGGAEITDYTVQYRVTGAESWITFTHDATGATSGTVTGLEPAKTYEFQVAAVNSAGAGGYSLTSNTLTTLAVVPDAPTDVHASILSAVGMSLSWSAPAYDGGASITDYVVQYRVTGTQVWFTALRSPSSEASGNVGGLRWFTSYEFRVAATNSQGTGEFSAPSSPETTLPAGPDVPTNLIASNPTATSIDLSWTAPDDDGGSPITGYYISYRRADSVNWIDVTSPGSATTFTVTGLERLTSYIFEVSAFNAIDSGSWTDDTAPVSTTADVPGQPTAVTAADPTTSSIRLSWTGSVDDGGDAISDYRVQYKLASGGVWTTFEHAASTATSLTVTGLTAGTSYLFRVAAVNGMGTGSDSVASTAVSTLRLPGVPGKPVVGTRTKSSMRISWSAAAGNGSAVSNYVVEYRRGTGAWATFAHAASSATAITVTGLVTGASYTFRVSAVSAAGTGATSPVSLAGLAASDPGAPGSVNAKPTTKAGQLKVTWTAAAANGAPSVAYSVSWLVAGKWTRPVAASGLSYLITGLSKGTYSVKVTATTVEGSASATKTGITLAK